MRVAWEEQRRFPLQAGHDPEPAICRARPAIFQGQPHRHARLRGPPALPGSGGHAGFRRCQAHRRFHQRPSKMHPAQTGRCPGPVPLPLRPRPQPPPNRPPRMRPAPETSPEQTALAGDLHWLIHQGHVIEFANGILETAKKPLPRPPNRQRKSSRPLRAPRRLLPRPRRPRWKPANRMARRSSMCGPDPVPPADSECQDELPGPAVAPAENTGPARLTRPGVKPKACIATPMPGEPS